MILKVKCPQCGEETIIDNQGNKTFVFCTGCGNKILLNNRSQQSANQSNNTLQSDRWEYSYTPPQKTSKKPNQTENIPLIDEPTKGPEDADDQAYEHHLLTRPSALSIVAFVLSLLLITTPIALILAIVDLAVNKDRKHGFSIAALSISCVFILIYALTTSSDKNEQSNQPAKNESTYHSKEVLEYFDEDKVIASLKTEEYHTTSTFGTYNKCYLLVHNNSPFELDIDINLCFYKDDSIVGAEQSSVNAVASGHDAILSFDTEEEYDHISYTFSVKESFLFKSAGAQISYTATKVDDKLVISITNNGDKDAYSVEAEVLFFKNGKCIGHDWEYFYDNDFILRSGKTISKETSAYKDYDDYKIVINGYKK